MSLFYGRRNLIINQNLLYEKFYSKVRPDVPAGSGSGFRGRGPENRRNRQGFGGQTGCRSFGDRRGFDSGSELGCRWPVVAQCARRLEEDAGDLLYRHEDAAHRHRQQDADRRDARRRIDGLGRRGGRGLCHREAPRRGRIGRLGQRRDAPADARGLGGRGDDGTHGRRADHRHGGRPRR